MLDELELVVDALLPALLLFSFFALFFSLFRLFLSFFFCFLDVGLVFLFRFLILYSSMIACFSLSANCLYSSDLFANPILRLTSWKTKSGFVFSNSMCTASAHIFVVVPFPHIVIGLISCSSLLGMWTLASVSSCSFRTVFPFSPISVDTEQGPNGPSCILTSYVS